MMAGPPADAAAGGTPQAPDDIAGQGPQARPGAAPDGAPEQAPWPERSAPARQREDEAKRLATIRERCARLGDAGWQLAAIGGETMVTAPGMNDEPEAILVFTEAADSDAMMAIAGARDDLGFLLGLVDRATTRIRELAPRRPKNKDYAAEAAMMCQRVTFQQFLADLAPSTGDAGQTAADLTSEARAAARLRSVLCVASRRALNTDDGAQTRWRRLKDDYFKGLKRG